MTATIEELFVEELFDFEITCEWNNNECQNKAEWHVWTHCCNTQGLLCDNHLRQSLKQNQDIINQGMKITCAHCFTNVDEVDKWMGYERL